METVNYEYPVGDFLSGFSEDENNPCDYELECQRMVKRGVEYLDEHPELFDEISKGGVGVSDKICEPMINFMCSNPDSNEESFGQTGAMVHHTVKHAYNAKKLGWDNYIQQITVSGLAKWLCVSDLSVGKPFCQTRVNCWHGKLSRIFN